MANIPIRRGFLRSRDTGSNQVNQSNIAQVPDNTTSPITTSGSIPSTPLVDSRTNPTEAQAHHPRSTSGVIRRRGNRNQNTNVTNEEQRPDSNDSEQQAAINHHENIRPDSNDQQRQTTTMDPYNQRRPDFANRNRQATTVYHNNTHLNSSDHNRQYGNNPYQNNRPFPRQHGREPQSATNNSATKTSSRPHVTYQVLLSLFEKSPERILADILHPHFKLQQVLNDKQMRQNENCIRKMTEILAKVIECEGSNDRLVLVLQQLPKTAYIEGVYDEIRKPHPITDQLRYDFIQLFLQISIKILTIIPHSIESLTKVIERIELYVSKIKIESPDLTKTKALLDEVTERMNDIECLKREKEKLRNRDPTTTTTRITIQSDIGPPPDDYRQLAIIPNVNEILSEEKPYLRENIVNGVYESPEHYLDTHFRLLREDFVGPLREGIQQYKSGAPGKNYNVRIYENVRSLGPRLSPRSGLVYDLYLDPGMVSRITWTNSRRLMFGNLLVLTFDGFQSCAFVTVEDRSLIEQRYTIGVKKLDKLNNEEQIQIELDDIDFSRPLVMIETTTYFEAYRPVLNALQVIPTNETFPLAPFLLQLSSTSTPPDYITQTSAYDFTPLLVEPNSKIKAEIIIHEITPQPSPRYRGKLKPITQKEFRLTYQQSNQIPAKYKSVPLLNTDQWPTSDELHLNPKQRDALILALTNKVALIQGPPGTGKTFLGVRITEMLLHNRSVWCPIQEQSTPILMICHTNHALDQFLELIVNRLNMTEGIIRVGNRCQNQAIQRFSLVQARRFTRDNRLIPGSIYHQKHTILDRKAEAEEKLKIYTHHMEISRRNIVSLAVFLNTYVVDDRHSSSLLAPCYGQYNESILMEWLGLGHNYEQIPEDSIDSLGVETSLSMMNIDENEEKKSTTEEEVNQDNNEETKQTTDQDVEKKDENQNNEEEMNEEEEEEQRRRDELEIEEEEYFTKSIVEKPRANESTSSTDQTTNKDQDDDDDGEGAWTTVKMKPYDRRRIIEHILRHPTTLTDETVQNIQDDVWQLSTAQRHDLYRYWLLKYQQYLFYSARQFRLEYNQAIAALADYHQEEDYYILKDSVIVAMTTTGAAKYHSVIEKLQNKIVIVEEAAAIFEAHIITALSTKCEHLILIGDHVQLRPSPSVYRLSTKYHIDVSLFERFVNNKFPNVRLNIQHRMRPEIARLMKHFYDDLEDHSSVKSEKERPPIRSVESNVFFINHNNLETAVTDGSSKRNEFEAQYVIALAQYLVKQGYKGEQITILVMYLGQRQYIARQTKTMKILQGVRITVTDNYQGEESDIIILSLVRSNPDKKIGFLKTHNRICVALSRARCGLFVIGNMDILADVDDMWKKILKSADEQKELGRGLSLSCRQHAKDKFLADKPESFAQRPEGGCNKLCNSRLNCGHQCDRMCHNYDFEHRETPCRKKCSQTLPCGHQCTKRCHAATPKQHDPCRVFVEKIIVGCGHKIQFQCSLTPKVTDCTHPILRRLDCGHAVEVPCRIGSSPSELKRFSCPKPCDTMLACKHKCVGTCGKCRTGKLHLPCGQKCDRELICSHVCKEPCASSCPPCLRECQARCSHSQCKKRCGELCTPCIEPCAYKCQHLQCTRLCSEPCNRGPCNQPCDKTIQKCGHPCIGICGEPCPRQCRICNKHIVQEILFGSEDEEDARFVFLPDCHHLIEVTALDRFVQDFVNDRTENKAIRFPECPRCRQKIRRCVRYMPIINEVNKLIAEVKKKILGNQSENEIAQRRQDLIKEYERTLSHLKEVPLGRLAESFTALSNRENFVSNDMLILMTNILLFINEIDKLLIDGRKKLSANKFDDLVYHPLIQIVNYLSEHRRHRNFAEQQITDLEAELNRFRRLIYIEALITSLKQTLKPDEQEGVDTMQYLVTKAGPFTADDQQKFDSLVKRFEHLSNLPGLGINERERLQIIKAFNLAKGHWYVCPRGHPYVITECGGANQESHCPECGERIGGQNHQLLATNRHFGLMDGSEHSAWSNEANILMNPQ